MTILFLNDTSSECQLGSVIVSQYIIGCLTKKYPEDRIISMYRSDFFDRNVIKKLDKKLEYHFIIINGEGSIYGGSSIIRPLWKILNFVKKERPNIPIYLINSSIEKVSQDVRNLLNAVDQIIVRDYSSFLRLYQIGIHSRISVDLSIFWIEDCVDLQNTRVIRNPKDPHLVFDSADPSASKVLKYIAEKQEVPFRSILMANTVGQAKTFGLLVRGCRIFFKCLIFWVLKLVAIEKVDSPFLNPIWSWRFFFDELRSSSRIISGRFHVACFCIALRRPFVLFCSLTNKNSDLVRHFGLDHRRYIDSAEKLNSDTLTIPRLSRQELSNVSKTIKEGRQVWEDFLNSI